MDTVTTNPRIMSMGACGDVLGLNMVIAVGASVLQVFLMMTFIFSYPAVKADIFSSRIRLVMDSLTNTTAIDLYDPIETHYMHSVNISAIFLIISGLVAAFAVMSYQIASEGLAQSDVSGEDYVSENVEFTSHSTIVLWNQIFLLLVVSSHVLVAGVMCSPCSIHFLIMTGFLVYYAFSKILLPRNQSVGGRAQSTSSMTAIILYVTAMYYSVSNIALDTSLHKAQVISILVFVDLLTVIVGHVWDAEPTFKTILNCRMLYLLLVGPMLLAIYAMWHPTFRNHFVHAAQVAVFDPYVTITPKYTTV